MTRSTARKHGLLLLGLAVFIGCGRALLRDPSFEDWCGDTLCEPWRSEGSIARIGTWHPADYGVSLGDDAAISQLFDGAPVECVELAVIADVDARAEVYVEMDFRDDGSVDYEQPIPESHWARLDYLIAMPSWYGKARLTLRKHGHGRAVLAQIEATESSDCQGPAPELLDRPLGARCESKEECQSGICASAPLVSGFVDSDLATCSLCEDDGDCSDGEVCGASADALPTHRACLPALSRPLGDFCAVDDECESGVCCSGMCSECCRDGDAACDSGACDAASVGEALFPLFLCAPTERPREPGEACTDDEHCVSGSCDLPALECLVPCDGDDPASCEKEGVDCRLERQLAGTCR